MTEQSPSGPPISGTQKAWAGFIIGILMSMGAVVTAALADGVWSTGDTIAAVIALVGSVGVGLGVYQTPNQPKV